MNWPTAFVISTIILAGAFLYSDRPNAGILDSGGMISASDGVVYQMRDDNAVCACALNPSSRKTVCFNWAN